jgi:hypothetical protein
VAWAGSKCRSDDLSIGIKFKRSILSGSRVYKRTDATHQIVAIQSPVGGRWSSNYLMLESRNCRRAAPEVLLGCVGAALGMPFLNFSVLMR